jgi:hypothetical protein
MAALACDFGVSEPSVWRVLRGRGEPVAAPVAKAVPKLIKRPRY